MSKKIMLLILVSAVVLAPTLVFAQDYFGTGYLGGTNLPDTDVREAVINLINVLLGVLGLIFLILVLYGGFLWMTAGGNDSQAEKGRAIIRNGVIGLVVIFLAFAITNLVFTILTDAT